MSIPPQILNQLPRVTWPPVDLRLLQETRLPQPMSNAPWPTPPQWDASIRGPALLQFQNMRDLVISSTMDRVLEERRRRGEGPLNETLINPLGTEARVASIQSPSRFHPILRQNIAHDGVDIVPVNYNRETDSPPPVYAASTGTVIYVGKFSERAGNYIMVLDRDNRVCCYAHLADGSTNSIRVGDEVQRGQQIALMGNTGPVDINGVPLLQPHLHFGVRLLSAPMQMQAQMARSQRQNAANLTVQPINADGTAITDPSINYKSYDVINPPIGGVAYTAVGQRVPATPTVPLVARNVTETPARTAAIPAPVAVDPVRPSGQPADESAIPVGSPPMFRPRPAGNLPPF